MNLDPRTSAALACAALLLATHAPAQDCRTVTGLASCSSSGAVGNGRSETGVLCLDGRYVAFVSVATNLAIVPFGPWTQVNRRDRVTGEVRLVSALAEVPAQDSNSNPHVSRGGSWTAFRSEWSG